MYLVRRTIAEINYNTFNVLSIIDTEDSYFGKYDDKSIAEFINMDLTEYRHYLKNNFKCDDIFYEITFELSQDIEPAIEWLKDKLMPLNVLKKMSKKQ